MSSPLPPDFEEYVRNAIKAFWQQRLKNSSAAQEGGRGAVIGGKNLDGFTALIKKMTVYCGLPEDSVIIQGKSQLTIPGYFRPTKMWDALVVHRDFLIAAFELKSQVGSFSNNFNNRTEESVGSAHDFWTAHREGAFDFDNTVDSKYTKTLPRLYAKPPFLAYLMMLELCSESTSPVHVEEKHYKVFPDFKNSSYAKRYQLLCEKLVSEKLYSSSCLMLSDRVNGLRSGAYNSPHLSHSPKSLFADFAAHLLAAIELYG
ncbi:restriction endonuclease [candidate division KSB1 bacterium]|nr:restriction endonuclease [candidate division KSB1 bacterium]RQW08781.1 MAG: restriction endonuclease [candidate division KSB1 bacterium]